MRLFIYILSILYVISPFDLIPDFLFGAGWVDDLIVLGLLGWYHFIYRKRKAYRDPNNGTRQSAGQSRKGFHQAHSFKSNSPFDREVGEKNPYEVLGVGNKASIEEIKRAYRRLSRQYHPDRVTHLGEEFRVLAEERFKEIQGAYQEINEWYKV